MHQSWIWLSGGQRLDLGGQAALVTSCLVLVEDALVGDGVDDGLSGLEQVGGLGLVMTVRNFERSAELAAFSLTS